MKSKKTKMNKLTNPPSSSSSSSRNTDSKPSDLHIAVVRIAVAQICNSIGYKGSQTSALETLTAITLRYLQSLASSAATSATSTGRTQCNLLDIVRALEDLHSNTGFHGNSVLHRRLYKLTDSSILRDTMKFVHSSSEIPFAKPLPCRQHSVLTNSTSSNSACFVSESGHIPRWLPAFPKVADSGGKAVVRVRVRVPIEGEDEIGLEKTFKPIESDRRIGELPEKRRKVSFRIGRGGGGKNVIGMESEGDLRGGVCKGRKRVLTQTYEGECFVNVGSSE